MEKLDYLKALGFAILVLVVTMTLSIPMVALYRYAIEPGQPPQFYMQAAQWIAPWSSHILGPLIFLAINYRVAKQQPNRHAKLFATITIILYVIVDFGMLPLMGYDLIAMLTTTTLLSLSAKLAGALLGAQLGARVGVTAKVVPMP